MTDFVTRIATLESALAKGVLTVESDGERVTYQSVTSLVTALDYLRRQEAARLAPTGVAPTRTTYAIYGAD